MSTTRPSVNITPLERIARIIVGIAGMVTAAVLLQSAGSWVAVFLEVLLALAGLDMLVTGATGHCPLYKKLGHVPASLKRRTS